MKAYGRSAGSDFVSIVGDEYDAIFLRTSKAHPWYGILPFTGSTTRLFMGGVLPLVPSPYCPKISSMSIAPLDGFQMPFMSGFPSGVRRCGLNASIFSTAHR